MENKLIKFQKEVETIKKDSKNPFFKSNYFDINSLLAEIKPVLNNNELIIIQPLRTIDGKPAIGTVVIDAENNEILSDSNMILPDLQDPQKMGSAITYYRRYSLQSLLCLQAEDDDGNKASKNNNINYYQLLEESKDINELKKKWANIPGEFKDEKIIKLKDSLKEKLSK